MLVHDCIGLPAELYPQMWESAFINFCVLYMGVLVHACTGLPAELYPQMEESANIEFLYGGCLPLQPGSQLSDTHTLGRCRPRFLRKRFQRARIIIAEGSGNVNSFFGFFRKLLKGEPVRAAVPGAARKRHAGESMSCRGVPRHEGGEKSGFPFAPGVREGRFFAALRMTMGGGSE